MFSHVMIGTNDLEKAKSFYDALLGTLGVPPGRVDRHRIFYMTKTGVFKMGFLWLNPIGAFGVILFSLILNTIISKKNEAVSKMKNLNTE